MALITFLNKQDAINAMYSPEYVFGNVLIKKSFYSASQFQAPQAACTGISPESHEGSNQGAPIVVRIQPQETIPKV